MRWSDAIGATLFGTALLIYAVFVLIVLIG